MGGVGVSSVAQLPVVISLVRAREMLNVSPIIDRIRGRVQCCDLLGAAPACTIRAQCSERMGLGAGATPSNLTLHSGPTRLPENALSRDENARSTRRD